MDAVEGLKFERMCIPQYSAYQDQASEQTISLSESSSQSAASLPVP